MALASPLLSRHLIPHILFINFVICLIVIGLASWALNGLMDMMDITGSNPATPNFAFFSLLAGVVGIASILSGAHLLRWWRSENVPATRSSAFIAWFLLLIAFGFACKEITFNNRSTALKFLEAFVIVLTATEAYYLLLLHLAED